MMTETAPKQKRQISQRTRTHGVPELEADLGVSRADADPQRPTHKESEPSRSRELAVILWVLALLLAEVELWSWIFARMYS